MTYCVTTRNWTFQLSFHRRPVTRRRHSLPDRAFADHLQDSGPLETMRAYAAADRSLHGPKRERAIDADALGRHLNLIVILVGGSGVLGGFAARFGTVFSVRGRNTVRTGRCGARKPGRCMGNGWRVVLWVTSIMDDFFKADVIIVRGVSVRVGELVGWKSNTQLFKEQSRRWI